MKISNREKVFVAISIVIILMVLYYSLFYKDMYHEINVLKNEIQRAKKDLADTPRSKSQIKGLEENIAQLLAGADENLLNLDSHQVEPQIIVFLEDSIAHLGMGTGVKFEEIEEYEEYDTITVILGFETSYENLREILSNLEEAPWPLMIDHLRFNKKQTDSTNPSFNWDVEVILRFLFFPQ